MQMVVFHFSPSISLLRCQIIESELLLLPLRQKVVSHSIIIVHIAEEAEKKGLNSML